MNLDDLQTYVRVVETGSFTKAAELLGVPKSTVSRRVARLEDSLGVELLARKARSFRITADGQRLHAQVAPALRDIADVEHQLSGEHESVRGPLRITAPHDFGASDLFSNLIASFIERWPGVVPEVELTMRTVDLLEEGFDVAFRLGGGRPLADLEGIMVRRFRSIGGGLMASRRYLTQCDPIEEPSDLRRAQFVGFSVSPRQLRLRNLDTGEDVAVDIEPVAICNDLSLLGKLLQRDLGIGFLPEVLAPALASRDQLVPVLPRWKFVGGELAVLWPARRHLAPRVRSFIDFALAHLQGSLPTAEPV